ncbi:MAG: NADH-quinone oxidoreductase subunit H [Pseudomonadota bacterium]
MEIITGILTQLVHMALVIAGAPVLLGLVRLAKARLMGRRGPHPLQPWRDLRKLLGKRAVVAETASAVTHVAPWVALAAALLAAFLIPSFARGMVLAPLADLVLVAGLLALGRVAMALAALDAGTPFGGLGASREMAFAVFAEPALILAALTFSIIAGTTNIDAIAGAFQDGAVGVRVSLALALIAMLAIAVAENGRIPVDNPSTHLELTMVHEAMILEASAEQLAIWDYQAALRLMLWLSLIAAIFFPVGLAAPGAGPVAWLIGIGAYALKLGALGFALAVFESSIAKMRVFRVPEFVGAALLLGLLAAVLLFLSTGFA